MKIESGFWQLAVGHLISSDAADGIVVQVLADGALVKVCWPENDTVQMYTEDEWREYGFTAYRIV